jgi:hypothetical protein
LSSFTRSIHSSWTACLSFDTHYEVNNASTKKSHILSTASGNLAVAI